MGSLVQVEKPQLPANVTVADIQLIVQRIGKVVQGAFDALQAKDLVASGVLVSGVKLTPGSDAVVRHGLKRAINGWFVIRKNATFDAWESSAKNALPSSYILLTHNAVATTTASFWVF